VSSVIIEARNDGSRIRKFVLIEETIEPLLNDLLISDVRDICRESQNFVAIASTVEASLVVFSSFPVVIEVSEPFVDFEVVESHIGNHLFLYN